MPADRANLPEISQNKKTRMREFLHYKNTLALCGALSLATLLPSVASAACAPGELCNPLRYTEIGLLIRDILGIVVYIGFFIAIFFIIYSGYLFVTAAGNVEKIKEARHNFMWTIIGVAILLGAQALSYLVLGTVQQVAPGTIPGF